MQRGREGEKVQSTLLCLLEVHLSWKNQQLIFSFMNKLNRGLLNFSYFVMVFINW